MRFLLSSFAVLAALILIAVSGACNFLFMQSIGRTTLEGYVFGSMSVAVDVFKAILPVLIWWAWTSKRFAFVVPASVVFVAFSLWSYGSAVGFAADNRGHVAETREGLNSEFESVKSDITTAEAKLASLPAHRSAGVIENDIAAKRQNRRWQSTKKCKEGGATASKSRAFCAQYFKLKGELEAAIEDKRLTRDLERLRGEQAKLSKRGAGQDVDPQVSILAKLLGRDEGSVKTALILFVAGLLEVGSGLGLWLATGHSQIFARRNTTPSHETAQPKHDPVRQRVQKSKPKRKKTVTMDQHKAHIDKYLVDHLVAAEEGGLSHSELEAHYLAYCTHSGIDAPEKAFFHAVVSQLLLEDVGIPERNGIYVGIGLKPGTRVAA